MSSSTLLTPVAPRAAAVGSARFAVTWQHPQTRLHRPVGLLSCEDAGYTFRYLRNAGEVEGFRPFIGFDDLERTYESERLFPLFSQRVMRPSRPDYARYLETLWLPPSADAWQILARSNGQREGDGIRLFLEPFSDASGHTEGEFLVHGLRHLLLQNPSIDATLARLRPGQHLQLLAEPTNAIDQHAVLVLEPGGPALGYVPMTLCHWVHTMFAEGGPTVQVAHVNGVDVPASYRLLVQVSGHVPPGWRAFDGPEWAPAGQ